MNDMTPQKTQQFFTAREMAELAKERGLANFPHTVRGVKDFADRNGWHGLGDHLCRKRQGRGGGMEYHYTLFPERLRLALDGKAMRLSLMARHEAQVSADKVKLEALRTHSLPARARVAMEARAEILASIEGYAISKGQFRPWGMRKFLRAQDEFEARQEIEARRDAGEILTDREAASLAQPLLLTAEDGFNLSPDRLVTANDRSDGQQRVSERTLFRWFKARDDRGVSALAPIPPRTQGPIHPGFAGFLKFYARPSKPSATDALKEYLDTNPAPEKRITITQVRHILRNRLNNIEKNVGREGLLTLRSRLAYVTRTTDDMWPTTIYTADGKTFDAEIADPVTKRPIRPEITTVMDVVTRKIVGISLGRSENQRAVAEALRRSCVDNGICAIFYVDRGPGYRNQALDADVSGLMGRLGITKMHAAPYGSQAKGRIERPNATVWDTLAKRLPTYIGKDMDKEAGDKVHKLTRRELKEFGHSRLLPSWEEFVSMCDAMVAEHNSRPHRSLPKFLDPETGKLRHMNPNEVWETHVSNGFEPVAVDQDEVDDLFRPYEIRTVRRCEVAWQSNTYFDHALHPYHETRVMVGYDYHQADRVWVREFDMETGQPGKLICVAQFMANAQRYVPKSFEEKALETRAKGQIKRLEDKKRAVEEQLRTPYLVDAREEEQELVFDAVPPQPDPVPAHALQVAVDNTTPAPARRQVFTSDEELAAWALKHPEDLSPKQAELLRECLNSSTARQLFRLSGIDTEALGTLLRAMPKPETSGMRRA